MNIISNPSRKKNRLEDFLYKEWYLFVTINTQDHITYFGKEENDEIHLNIYGKIIEECWYDLTNHYSNILLDKFVVMPNHVHGIIIIENVGENHCHSSQQKSIENVGEGFKPSLTIHNQCWLSEIIRWFKTFSSRKIHDEWLQSFQRQRSFYDHIIRNEDDLQRIQEYIQLNPYKRKNDEYYR